MNDFLEDRRTGIGGSDVAAALGISPWRTPYDLWCEKLGEAEPLPVTEPMRWGTLLEPVIAAEYSRRTGRAIETVPMLRHPYYGWMIAHLDRRIVGEPRILEVKTSGTGIGWGEPGTDQIPLHYITQVHHYLIVAEAKVADVVVLVGGSDFRVYEVHRDDEIEDELINKEHAFWAHVLDRSPPDPVNTQDAVRRWGRQFNPGAVVASETDIEAITTLRQIRDQRAMFAAEEESFRLTVMQSLADRGDTLVDLAGTPLATWKLDKGRKAFSVAARDPARRFLLKD